MTHGRDARRGLKRSLLDNRTRFRERWKSVLAGHPDSNALPRDAAERLCGPGLLVLAEREPELDERGALPREWAFLERAQRAGQRVSLWSRHPSEASSANRLLLQRRGIELPHSPEAPSLAAYLRRSGRRFANVIADRDGNSVFCPRPVSL